MRPAQKGVALLVGLLLLLLMTLLALIVMVRTSTELMMTASEQYRRRASQSASAAIEDGIAHIGLVQPAKGVAITRGPAALVDGSLERYTSTSTFLGTEDVQMGSSAGRFAALDYSIDGVGTSARAARDEQSQGLAVIVPTNGVSMYTRAGSGLP